MNQKKKWKKRYKQCAICEEDNYNLLDTHRIIWGGEYVLSNVLIVCSNCHRKIHAEEIEIIQKTKSTKGELLIYIEDGIEIIKEI